jgi:hypothetical protein
VDLTIVITTNKEETSAELFENEVVVINFVDGTYFSIRGAALALWHWLEQGVDETVLVELLDEKYQLGAAESKKVVTDCIAQLRGRGLVVDSDEPPADRDTLSMEVGMSEFEVPVVEAFEDLQELIAIDPVHEVDPMQGWPHRPPKVELD